jgi:hypothetical protein
MIARLFAYLGICTAVALFDFDGLRTVSMRHTDRKGRMWAYRLFPVCKVFLEPDGVVTGSVCVVRWEAYGH